VEENPAETDRSVVDHAFDFCIFLLRSSHSEIFIFFVCVCVFQRSPSQSSEPSGSSMDAAKAASKAAESFQLDDNFLDDDSDVESAPVAAMKKENTRKQKQFDDSSDRMLK
jgi:hypothetical protein